MELKAIAKRLSGRICEACGATLETCHALCTAGPDDQCEGISRIERAKHHVLEAPPIVELELDTMFEVLERTQPKHPRGSRRDQDAVTDEVAVRYDDAPAVLSLVEKGYLIRRRQSAGEAERPVLVYAMSWAGMAAIEPYCDDRQRELLTVARLAFRGQRVIPNQRARGQRGLSGRREGETNHG